jgi:single-stranded-DNA-specific exonuclease
MSTLEKNWQMMPKISNEFIEKYPEYNRVVLQLLFNRGLIEKGEIEEFLAPLTPSPSPAPAAERERGDEPPNPPYQGGSANHPLDKGGWGVDPFLFKDMEKAVELVIRHIKSGNKIIVYGDYDADGVTASAVLYDVLTIFKAKAEVYIPDRVSEGYGLNKDAIKELAEGGAKLIITVDGGIRSREEVEFAKSLGVDVLITDHHVPPNTPPTPSQEGTFNPPAPLSKGGELPDCLTINPLVEGEKYPFKFLAGVGVAFKLAKAIIFKAKLADEDKKKLEERILDLVAIGTVADCVSLLGENRTLVKMGLEALNNTRRVGLQELIKIAQINPVKLLRNNGASGNKKLDSWNIGFQIGPRLNAAGRMDHANTALELLITKNKEEAEAIARTLNSRNQERQQATESIVEQIEFSLTPSPSPAPAAERERGDEKSPQPPLLKGAKIIVAVTPDGEVWNEGVVGLVAGRICERYYLPTLVITKGEEGYKGSGRSIAEFNIMEALEECKDLFLRYGGHPMACGFSLVEKNLEEFKKRITVFANKKLKNMDLKPGIEIEAELNLDEIDEKFVEAIEQFAPFGQGNDKPKFVSYGISIVDIMNMGLDGKHIKLRITNPEHSGLRIKNIFSAVGFGQAERWKELKIGDKIDIVYYLEMNEFNGRRDAQMKIVDIKSHNT